jgi:hypothetical protein
MAVWRRPGEPDDARVGKGAPWENVSPMAAALLIASLALLVGMFSQLALLSRRHRTADRKPEPSASAGTPASGALAVADRGPAG